MGCNAALLREVGLACEVAGRDDGELARVPLLIEGMPVQYRDGAGQIRDTRAWLFDWDAPDRNDFLAVNQFTVAGVDERRPNVVLFVNCPPLVLMELTRPGEPNGA